MKEDYPRWLYAFIVVIFSLVITACLLFCFLGKSDSVAVKLGCLLIAFFCMVFLFYSTEKQKPLFEVTICRILGIKVHGKTFDIYAEKFGNGSAMIGVDDRKIQSADITQDEEELRRRFTETVKTGFTKRNCKRAIKIFEEYSSAIGEWWRSSLNKARTLARLERFREAELIVLTIMSKFSINDEAIGCCYEVLAFIEEIKALINEGPLKAQAQTLRKIYVLKGLEILPKRHALLMSAMEIALGEKNFVDAARYLNEAIGVDRLLTISKLATADEAGMEMIILAKNSSWELKETIEKLLEGEKNMKKLTWIKATALVFLFLISMTTGIYNHGRFSNLITIRSNVRSVLSLTTNIIGKAANFRYSSRCDGTDTNKADSSSGQIGTDTNW